MRNTVSRAKRGMLVLSPLALLVSMAASAQIAPVARDAMKRDLGLTDAQVSQYYEIEQLAESRGLLLAKAQGTDFAGSWIERNASGEYQFVVATTSKESQKVPAGVTTRQAKHSLASLEAAKAQLDAIADSAPEGVYAWGVDVRSNAVSIDVAPGAQREAIDFVAASGADPGTIRFSPMESRPVPLVTFMGGSEYLSRSGGSFYYCSVGFAAYKTGYSGFVTAGHCGNANDTVHVLVNRRTASAAIGKFQGSFYPNQGDGAWVSLDAGHTVLPTVDGYNSADIPVHGATVAAIGSNVCRSGRTTGLHCGTIEAYNQTVNYPDTSVSGLTRVKVCAEGGDSGGSFITGAGQAQGTLSGGNYSCKGTQAQLATSYFQPIGEILQTYGLTLRTQ
jgi:streptogrisin C